MTKSEQVSEFLDNMFKCNVNEMKSSSEYEIRKLRQEHIDQLLYFCLTPDELDLVEEILDELKTDAENDAKFHYEQGIKDCVWLLKYLGVLA